MVDSKSRSQSEKFVPLVPAPTYSVAARALSVGFI